MKAKEMISLLRSDSPAELARWAARCHAHEQREDRWIEGLRAVGVKAAHPDDGWVNREEDSVHFCYPHFDDGVCAGDRIALGSPDVWRIVIVTEIRDVGLTTPIRRHFFIPV